MGRKLVVGLVVVLVFAAAGTAFALLSDDDDTSDTAQGTTTTVATSASTPSTTTAATTAPPTTAPPSTAATGPADVGCGTEGGAIAAAVNAGVTGARDRAQVDECRLAVDPTWAGVRLVAKSGADFDAVTVVLHGGGGSWAIVGSGDAACAKTPQQVLVDLGLLCSSGGGGGL